MAEADTCTTVESIENGPYIVKSLGKLINSEGEDLSVKPRLALCRCGASANKPFCDGTHSRVGFTAAATPEPSDTPAPSADDERGATPAPSGSVASGEIKVRANGPYKVSGVRLAVEECPEDPYALCRCGASDNTPFCDGSHREDGFTDPDC
ncbi:MAG: CDGSH iron-sulfur domain-containing protein [Acidobacteriota bacterium]